MDAVLSHEEGWHCAILFMISMRSQFANPLRSITCKLSRNGAPQLYLAKNGCVADFGKGCASHTMAAESTRDDGKPVRWEGRV